METFEPGAVIDGRFTLVRRLGAGGAGVVWLAEDRLLLSSRVALKMLHPSLAEHPPAIERLVREAELLARLDHPSIARPLHLSTGARPYLVLEYVDGEPLSMTIGARAESGEQISIGAAARIFFELCLAIDYAHHQRVVHRDLKPDNVMLLGRADALFVKVLDLGVAKLLEAEPADPTTRGRKIGSLFYMSPEQTRGDPATTASDLFALGVIFFELLTSRRAFAWNDRGESLLAFTGPVPMASNAPVDVIERICSADRPRPGLYRPELGPEIDRLIAKATAVNPADRPQSARAFAEAISRALEAIEIKEPIARAESARGLALRSEPAPPKKRSRGWIGLVLLIGIGAALATYYRAPAVEIAPPIEPVIVEPRAVGAKQEAPKAPPKETPPVVIEEAAPKKTRRPELQPPPAKIESPTASLWALLRSAREDPSNAARRVQLSDAIVRAAAAAGEGRVAIERRAETAAMVGDLDGLEAALNDLDRALGVTR